MSKTLFARLGLPALVAAVALAGCGSRGPAATGAAASGSSSGGSLTIGFDAPLTGDESAVGLALKYSAEVAVQDANREHVIPGVKFQLAALDDQAPRRLVSRTRPNWSPTATWSGPAAGGPARRVRGEHPAGRPRTAGGAVRPGWAVRPWPGPR